MSDNLIHYYNTVFYMRQKSDCLPATIVHVRPIVEYNSIIWSPCLIKYVDLMENVQSGFTKRLICGLKNSTYEDRAANLGIKYQLT